MSMRMKKPIKREWIWILFAIYLLALLLLLFHRTPRESYSCNLTPFETIRYWLDLLARYDLLAQDLRPFTIMNLVGNLAVLIPMGIFLPVLFPRHRSFWRFLVTVILSVCLIELAQYLTKRGSLDVDDLILNVPGACLGWLLWRVLLKKNA